MKFIKQSVVILFLFLSLSCHAELSYDYLMEHPKVLSDQYKQCETETTPACDIVRRAAYDFDALIQAQNQDPEGFGREVMNAQAQLVALKTTYETEKSSMAKQAYEDQRTKLRKLYAVIALRTPE